MLYRWETLGKMPKHSRKFELVAELRCFNGNIFQNWSQNKHFPLILASLSDALEPVFFKGALRLECTYILDIAKLRYRIFFIFCKHPLTDRILNMKVQEYES